jgi:hypothetical protein
LGQTEADMKINVIMLVILAGISLFLGFIIISVAVGAIFPSTHKLTAPLICKGEVEVEVITYSYKPGQIGTDNHIYCIDEEGKREITWAAIGVSGLFYSAIIFAGLLIWGRKAITLPANFGELAPKKSRGSKKEGSAMERLAELKRMRDADLISQAEFERKKAKIMDEL